MRTPIRCQIIATPDDRTVYNLESGYQAIGRPVYNNPIGKQLLWVVFKEDKETNVGVFATRQEGEKLILDPRDRVCPIFESNITEQKRLWWAALPKEIPLSEAIIPPVYNPNQKYR